MAKESDNSRYLRSTITNIAFLGALAYFVHQKALSETSLVTIVTLFLAGYFGVRAYQHRTEADVASSQSNPRFPIPNYREPPEDPPTGLNTATTRRLEQPIVPRRDEPPTNPEGRGPYRRYTTWIMKLIRSGLAPVTIAAMGGLAWILVSLLLGQINFVIARLGGLQ